MQKIGFAVGTPWVTVQPDKSSSNHAAASTSWYATAGTSDDWLITPAMTLSGNHPTLSWRAKASDKNHRDGYAVYISTSAGTTVADFDEASPLFAVEEEDAEWADHTVSLQAYAGKTVTIAFVNNSTDKSRLYVDDISVVESHAAYLSIDLPEAVDTIGSLTISGTVSTRKTTPIEGYTIGLEVGGETFTQHFPQTLTAEVPHAFTLNHQLTIGKHETIPYTVWVEIDGDRNAYDRTVTAYQRKIVCEEGTGTWCGWCVRGLVMLDSIKNHYADRIIGIAAHTGDVMANDYVSKIGKYIGDSYPTGSVNRMMISDPRNFITYAQAFLKEKETLVDMDLQTTFDVTTRSVTATTTLLFADDQTDQQLAMAYAIIENAVHQPNDSKYSQSNAYANGENGTMGGYEQYGTYIPASTMYYNDVARGYVDDLLGIDGSIPNDVKAEEAVTHTVTFTLPDNILVDENVEIVAMVIDKSDGHIVNGECVPVGKSTADGISGITKNETAKITAIYGLDGQKRPSMQRGLNILRYADGHSEKVLMR